MNLPEKPTAYTHFINGEQSNGHSDERIVRMSPAHGIPVSSYPAGTSEDAAAAIAAAKEAFENGSWVSTPAAEREVILRKVAATLRERKDELGQIECLETGKPLAQAKDEMEWAAGIWDYAAALTRTLHADTVNTLGEELFGMTLREPIGVCALITPWNFPLLIVSQKLPFALAAGCTCVVKPSEFTSATTLILAQILKQAGLPDGVCNIVTGYGDPVGSVFSTHPDVEMVSFTGSTAVGKKIVAASADTLKKVSLELGGKNPQIIFPDADLDKAADAVALGAWFNMGECCNAGSRILVHDEIADELMAKVIAKTKDTKVGNPADAVQIGAIINPAQFEKIKRHIEDGKKSEASVAYEGNCPTGQYIAPVIFDKVSPDAPLAKEEIFGPVLTVMRFSDETEAVRIANSTLYGLSASVWTNDFSRAMRCTRQIKAGTVWVNTFLDGAPELPFGGYRQSGLGRELGPHSVEEFTELKTVTMRISPKS